MFILISLFNILSSAVAQTDLSKCDIEYKCILNPPGCTLNCLAIATFFYDKSNGRYIKELWSSASHKWVSFAQKSDNLNSDFMVNLQGQYCLLSSSTVLFGSFDATTITSNTAPKWVSTISGVEKISSAVFNDGSFSCRYTTNNTSSSNVFLAIAFGSTISGQLPSYHGYNRYTKSADKVNLMAIQKLSTDINSTQNTNSSIKTILNMTTTSITTTQITTTQIQGTSTSNGYKPDLSKCDKEFNCFLNPPGCTSNCIAIATFFYEKRNNVYVNELWSSASNKWISFAQKSDNSNSDFMVNLQGQYCLLSSSTVLFGSFDATTITSNSAPKWISTIPGIQMIFSTVFNDGSFICRYTTNANTSSSNVFLAIAFGSSINGELPSYHGFNSYSKSAAKVNLMAIQKVLSGSTLSHLKKGHGILMTLAWLFFATCGIFISRYMKPFLKTKIIGKDAWFRMHQLFMSLTLICFVIGLILILVDLKGIWSKNAGAHHILGLTAIVLGLLQKIGTVFWNKIFHKKTSASETNGVMPCIALLRCTPDHKDRYIFNYVHRFIGMSAWLIAAIAVIFGLKLLNINHVAVVIFIPVVVILFVILELILLKNKLNSEKSKPQVSYLSENKFNIEATSRESKMDEYISMFFMVVLFIFVAAVAVVVSIFIGIF